MNWKIIYLDEADYDLINLDNSVKKRVKKSIEKVSQNPLPNTENEMQIIVISARADNDVYTEAEKRIEKYGL